MHEFIFINCFFLDDLTIILLICFLAQKNVLVCRELEPFASWLSLIKGLLVDILLTAIIFDPSFQESKEYLFELFNLIVALVPGINKFRFLTSSNLVFLFWIRRVLSLRFLLQSTATLFLPFLFFPCTNKLLLGFLHLHILLIHCFESRM